MRRLREHGVGRSERQGVPCRCRGPCALADDRAAHRIVTVLAVAASLTPIVASAVAVGPSWTPASDTAIITTRARDVFTTDTPLLGQPSTAGATVGEQVHHPGPLEFWAIAAGQQVADEPVTSLVVITVVNAAAVLAILWWARSLAGPLGLALVAVPVTTMLWSLRGEILVDPLNPSAAVVPFTAYLVSLVAVGGGRRWALVSAVLAGSWAAQAHLTVTGLVAAAALAVATGVGIGRLGSRSAKQRPPRRHRRPAAVAAVLLIALWSGPVVDVVVHEGGNARALVAAGEAVEARPGGTGDAIDHTVRALSWPPVWAQADAGVADILVPPTTRDRLFVAAVWSAGFVAAVVNRRRAPGMGWAFGIATTVLASGTMLLSRLPGSFFNVFQLGNYLWFWPATALLWSATLGGVIVALVPRLPAPGRAWVVSLSAPLATAAAVGLAVAAAVTPGARIVQRDGRAYISALGDQLAATLDPDATYGIDLSYDLVEQVVDAGVLNELDRRGFDVRVHEAFAPSFGEAQATGLAGTAGTLVLDLDLDRPSTGGGGSVVVASYRPPRALVDRLVDAEAAVADRIDFVRGDFLGLAEIGLLSPEVAAWPETRALAEVRARPVLRAAVRLSPPPG